MTYPPNPPEGNDNPYGGQDPTPHGGAPYGGGYGPTYPGGPGAP